MDSSRKKKKISRRHSKTQKNNLSPMVLNAAGGDLKGEINLIWEPDKNARYYLLQKCSSLSKPPKWKYEDIVSKASCTVSNLKSNKTYMFRVAFMSESGRSPWSSPVIKKAP